MTYLGRDAVSPDPRGVIGGPPADPNLVLQGRTVPPPQEPFRDPSRLARVLVVLLVLSSFADLTAVVAEAVFLRGIRALRAGDFNQATDIESVESFIGMVGIVQTLMLLITSIVFVTWFRRLYRNLGGLGIEGLRYKAGWAVGGWFVPIVGLFRPKQIANDIWRASDPDLPSRMNGPGWGQPVWWLINVWWVLWLIGNRYGANTFLASDPTTLADFETRSITWLVGDSLSVTLDVVAVFLVRGMTNRQLARAARLQQEGPIPPDASGRYGEELRNA